MVSATCWSSDQFGKACGVDSDQGRFFGLFDSAGYLSSDFGHDLFGMDLQSLIWVRNRRFVQQDHARVLLDYYRISYTPG
jgi:hypothetical protein